MTQVAAGEWYIAVICEQCKHRVILFHDLSEGKSDLEKSQFSITCPNCNLKGSYPAEHYHASSNSGGHSPLKIAPIPLVYYAPDRS